MSPQKFDVDQAYSNNIPRQHGSNSNQIANSQLKLAIKNKAF